VVGCSSQSAGRGRRLPSSTDSNRVHPWEVYSCFRFDQPIKHALRPSTLGSLARNRRARLLLLWMLSASVALFPQPRVAQLEGLRYKLQPIGRRREHPFHLVCQSWLVGKEAPVLLGSRKRKASRKAQPRPCSLERP